MSTPFALAAVSAVLKQRLTAAFTANGVSAAVGGATVSVTSPDRVPVGAQEPNRVNLYLHRISRNQGWANAGPPPRGSDGALVSSLPEAIDLHYIISAYGQDAYTTDILLGHTVAALADEPVLTRAAIRSALAPNPPDPTLPAALGQSRLADQIENITITPIMAGMEEVSRLWSAFGAPLRPSVFYQVTTVLVEPRSPATTPYPVFTVGSAASASTGPQVEEVAAEGPPGTPIATGSTLAITGRWLVGDNVTVRIGSSKAVPTKSRASQLTVPLASFAPAVRPGLAGLVVTHDVELGDPPVTRAAAASTPVPIAVVPTLTFPANAVAAGPDSVVDGTPMGSGTITANVDPPVGREQHVTLALTESGAPANRPAHGAVLPAPPQNGAGANVAVVASIQFAYARVPKATYNARLRVDGVDSPLTRAGDGTFDGPAVTL